MNERAHGVLKIPGTTSFFVAACVGRVGIAMTSLSLVWLVHQSTGSFLQAGAVTGAFALSEALVGPLIARFVDRQGQRAVLPIQVMSHLAAVVILVLLASTGSGLIPLVCMAVLAGASIPQFGALSAARWSYTLRDHPEKTLQSAFSLESIANGSAFLIGPVIVSALGAAHLAAVSQAAAAAMIAIGGLTLASARLTEPPPTPGRSTAGGAAGHVRTRLGSAVIILVLMNLAVGIYFGSVQVSVTGFGVALGEERLVAVIFLVGSVGGLVGAFVYGKMRFRSGPHKRLLWLSIVFAGVTALLLAAGDVATLLPVVLVTELFIPPILVNLGVLMERCAPSGALTQAFTWANSFSAAGAAAASSLAGLLLDSQGSKGGFVVVVAGALLLGVLAVSGRRLLGVAYVAERTRA